MAQQDVKLFDAYGKSVTYQDIDCINVPLAGGSNANFYNTSEADNSGAYILAGHHFYGPSGSVLGQIGTYTGSYEVTSTQATLATQNKYCTADIVVNVPGGGGSELPAGVCTLTYKEDENTDYIKQYVVERETTYPPTPPEPPSGKVFVGWTVGGNIQTFPLSPTTDMTLIAHFITPADAIVGITGVTRSDGVLTLTDDAADMGGYTLQRKGPVVCVNNPLDSIFPFNEIREWTDSQGNVFIRIPKMSIQWITTTIDGISVIDGIKFSKTQSGGSWFIPSCFGNPNDMSTYLDSVYIGKYEAGGSGSRALSQAGKTPTYGTRSNLRNNIARWGSGYQQLDLSIVTLYNFLCMAYLQRSNLSYAFCTGRIAQPSGYTGACTTGLTTSIDTAFGFDASSDVPLSGWDESFGVMEILGVENPFANVDKWIDGVAFSGVSTAVFDNPLDFIDSVHPMYVDQDFYRPTSSGYVKYLSYSPNHPSMAFPRVIGGGAASDKYLGVRYIYDASGQVLMGGGCWNDSGAAGLWYLSGGSASTYSANFTGTRICYRPISG